MTDETLKVSSPRDFVNKRQQIVRLPSGLVARLRRPSLLGLIERAQDGVIPPAFKHQIQTQFRGKANGSGKVPEVSLADMEKVMRHIASAAFVEPTIVEDREPDYDAGEIGIDDVDPNDVQFVFLWVNNSEVGMTAAAERFPVERAAGVEPASGGEDVRDKAKRDS